MTQGPPPGQQKAFNEAEARADEREKLLQELRERGFGVGEFGGRGAVDFPGVGHGVGEKPSNDGAANEAQGTPRGEAPAPAVPANNGVDVPRSGNPAELPPAKVANDGSVHKIPEGGTTTSRPPADSRPVPIPPEPAPPEAARGPAK